MKVRQVAYIQPRHMLNSWMNNYLIPPSPANHRDLLACRTLFIPAGIWLVYLIHKPVVKPRTRLLPCCVSRVTDAFSSPPPRSHAPYPYGPDVREPLTPRALVGEDRCRCIRRGVTRKSLDPTTNRLPQLSPTLQASPSSPPRKLRRPKTSGAARKKADGTLQTSRRHFGRHPYRRSRPTPHYTCRRRIQSQYQGQDHPARRALQWPTYTIRRQGMAPAPPPGALPLIFIAAPCRAPRPLPFIPPPRLCLTPNAVAVADGTDQTDCGVKEHTLVKLAIDALLVRCRTCCDERPSHDEPYRTRQRLSTCQLRRRLVSAPLRHPPANGR